MFVIRFTWESGVRDLHSVLLSICGFCENMHSVFLGICEFSENLHSVFLGICEFCENLHSVLLSICEFCENWRREGRTFKWAYMELHFMLLLYDILKEKNALVKSVCLSRSAPFAFLFFITLFVNISWLSLGFYAIIYGFRSSDTWSGKISNLTLCVILFIDRANKQTSCTKILFIKWAIPVVFRTIIKINGVSQTQLVNILFYLKGVA